MSVASVSKALGGALAAALVNFLTQRGIVIDPELSDALSVVIAAAIGFVVVYFSPRNK